MGLAVDPEEFAEVTIYFSGKIHFKNFIIALIE